MASLVQTQWFDTNLEGASLDQADLQGASFTIYSIDGFYAEANIHNASFWKANLRGATIRPQQLLITKTLLGAIMPDGNMYDGRYNFPYDLDLFQKMGGVISDQTKLAEFYGVTLDNYLGGQRWVENNLKISKEGRNG